jgi:hypothetical protein
MNVALRGVHRLVQILVANDAIASPSGLYDSLAAFEAEVKPPMDARLADNHERGLEMDRLDPSETEGMRVRLAAVAADPALHDKYCVAAAGY